jgi:hypothetical protein
MGGMEASFVSDQREGRVTEGLAGNRDRRVSIVRVTCLLTRESR